MAIQLQIRRGTTVENDAFTGAPGELTMDTDTNGVRIHDGTTVGGIQISLPTGADYVVEWQQPTDLNNYTWYRKYKSGWVEQGGKVDIAVPTTTITLPVEMADTNYTVLATSYSYSSPNFDPAIVNVRRDDTLSTTSFKLMAKNSSAASYATQGFWQVCGMAAS